MSCMQRSARYFLTIKAAREFRKDIEKAGLDNLKILAENGISIVGTYLNGCSSQEKATYRQNLNMLLRMGVTPDMILAELTLQMTELAPIIEERPDYKRGEIQNLERFLKES